jgi:hypothetical protein
MLCCVVVQMLGGNNIGTIKLQPVLIQKVRETQQPGLRLQGGCAGSGPAGYSSPQAACTALLRLLQYDVLANYSGAPAEVQSDALTVSTVAAGLLGHPAALPRGGCVVANQVGRGHQRWLT